ncbi:unnamed protein product [Ceutorhynchus assimilis]|uniref:Regulatory protein zeste n=1 Tax=Ceutorhynchus assimilis TaxID=467358 RepID=A0A9N9N2I4_9CUCU|nr:unnamed protein product [Ceutorhynchus assimilis]
MSEAKKRAPNFSPREKNMLLNTVFAFKGVIENKKTDSVTWRQKDDAWDQIASLFNSQTPENHHRTKDSLRKLYENIKKNVRKDVAFEKREHIKTGGGPGDEPIWDATTELALSIMNHKTVNGLPNQYDLDAQDNEIPCQARTASSSTATVTENEDIDHSVSPGLAPIIFDVCKDIPSPGPSTSKPAISPRASGSRKDDFEPPCPETKASIIPPLTPSNNILNTNWGDFSAIKLQAPVAAQLKQGCTKRRRPNMGQLSSSQLTDEYVKLGQIKMEYFEAEKKNAARHNERQEELFQLQKRKLNLEIAIKEEELKKIKNGN